jgi:hypothetical protein
VLWHCVGSQAATNASKVIKVIKRTKKIVWVTNLRLKRSSLSLLYPLGTDRTENISSLVACIRLRGNAFTKLFHSNGCTRHISYHDTSIGARGYYLATAVSVPPQFSLWANTLHYVAILGDIRNEYKTSVDGNRTLGRLWHGWIDSIKTNIKAIGYDWVDWLYLPQDSYQCRAVNVFSSWAAVNVPRTLLSGSRLSNSDALRRRNYLYNNIGLCLVWVLMPPLNIDSRRDVRSMDRKLS